MPRGMIRLVRCLVAVVGADDTAGAGDHLEGHVVAGHVRDDSSGIDD